MHHGQDPPGEGQDRPQHHRYREGIPAAIRDRVFDPFFTTKPVGKGTGQGLAMAYDVVVRKHAGTITFDTVEGEGTTFIVRLPLAGSDVCPPELVYNNVEEK